jgi:hypothetical protein
VEWHWQRETGTGRRPSASVATLHILQHRSLCKTPCGPTEEAVTGRWALHKAELSNRMMGDQSNTTILKYTISVYLYNPSNTTKENTLYCVSTSGSHHQAFLRTSIIIICLSWSWATCWPVPVSRVQKPLQMSAMIPSAGRGVVFHYPG